jgi:UDP-galactopyranose mutase
MIHTGPIDAFFDYAHGPLPYRSLHFERRTIEQEWHQEVGTVNYPNEYDYTRITEQKYLTGQDSPRSTLMIEYPRRYVPGENEPFYPTPRDENRELYRSYLTEASKLGGTVIFAGRLADYKYYNMDQVVARALSVFEKEVGRREIAEVAS